MTDIKETGPKVYKLSDLQARAVKLPPEASTYANYVYMMIQGGELYLDFYTIEPKPEDSKVLFMVHKSRMVLPIGVAKGLVSGLANVILRHEDDTQQIISDGRGQVPGDTVDIWSLLYSTKK
jgi:hypothetical protein